MRNQALDDFNDELIIDAVSTATYHQRMSHTVNIDDAKNQFSDLIATASQGGEVLIVENGKPLARLVPANDSTAYSAHPAHRAEFGDDEDLLAWDGDGWENVA